MPSRRRAAGAVVDIDDLPRGIVSIDIEATGLNRNGEDDILQVAAVDAEGRRASRHYSAFRHYDWADAERIHHISPRDVAGLPPIISPECNNRVRGLMRGVTVAMGWNVAADLQMLSQAGVDIDADRPCIDVMGDYGRWKAHETGGQPRKWKLSVAAAELGIAMRAHDALEDATATMRVAQALIDRGWSLVLTSYGKLLERVGHHGVDGADEMAVGDPVASLRGTGAP